VGSPEEQAPEEAFEQAASQAQAEGGGPEDAIELRGFHFRKLISSTSTLIVVGLLVVAAGVAAGVLLKSAPFGGIGAGAVLLIALIAIFAIADSRAADAFYEAYALSHNLTLMDGRMRMPEATPLLKKGDDRYAERLFEGQLGPDVTGKLANFTYEETTHTKDGKETNYYRYTVGLTQVPGCAAFIPELYVQRKFGFRALEGLEDAFRGKKERVKFESEQLDRKFEIFVHEAQDPNLVHQLFSPTFIVWLIVKAPDKFAFELVGGNLCCYVNGHGDEVAELDRMRGATTAVATRLREESSE
jgi:hypothetical protein